MIAGIVGLAGALLNDKPFRIPRGAANFRIHVIFAIAAARQPPLYLPNPSSSRVSATVTSSISAMPSSACSRSCAL